MGNIIRMGVIVLLATMNLWAMDSDTRKNISVRPGWTEAKAAFAYNWSSASPEQRTAYINAFSSRLNILKPDIAGFKSDPNAEDGGENFYRAVSGMIAKLKNKSEDAKLAARIDEMLSDAERVVQYRKTHLIPWLYADWEITTVDYVSGENRGDYTSICLDANGYPRISYYNASQSALRYAVWDGTSWLKETVDTVGGGGRNISLALDGSGNAHISYYRGTGLSGAREVCHASQGTGGWQIEVVHAGDINDAPGEYGTSIALDSNDNVHIVYGCQDGNICYACNAGGIWDIDTLNINGRPYYPSLALDNSNNPHVSYEVDGPSSNFYLGYAWYESGTWHWEVVDSAVNQCGSYSDIVLDEFGNPHISYLSATESSLKYAYYNGSSWETAVVDTNGIDGDNTSIALDGDGHPHISYSDNDNLKYAWNNGSEWQIETVDLDIGGENSSIAIDEENNPQISYTAWYGSFNQGLKYARWQGTGVTEDKMEEKNLRLIVKPNPSRGTNRISYFLKTDAFARLQIFNLYGKSVRSLVSKKQAPGSYQTVWDGRNNKNEKVPGGIYFIKLQAGDFSTVKKITVLR